MFPTLLEVFQKRAEFFMTAETGPLSIQERCCALATAIKKEPSDKTIILGQAEEKGVASIILINKNRKFVLESLRYFLKSIDKDLFFLSYPILALTYKDGNLSEIAEASAGDGVYSLIYAEVLNGGESEMELIKDSLQMILNRLEYVNNDYTKMLERIFHIQSYLDSHPELEMCQEVKNFLHWMCQDNFIFLCCQSYDKNLNLNQDSLLGICLVDRSLAYNKLLKDRLRHFASTPDIIFDFKRRTDLSTYVSKDGRISYISVKCGDTIHCIAGVLTSIAHRKPIQEIPYIGKKVAGVLSKVGSFVKTGSHDKRLLKRTLERYPREEIFEATVQELSDSASRLMHAEIMPRCKISIRHDPIGNFIYCLVALPQSVYSRKVFLQTQDFFADLLQAKAQLSAVEIFESQVALAYFCLQGSSAPKEMNLAELEEKVNNMLMDWNSLFLKALKEKYRNKAREIYNMYLPEQSYKNFFTPSDALLDLEKVLKRKDDVRFYKDEEDTGSPLRVNVYLTQRSLTLNEAVDYLAQIGLQVLKEDFLTLGLPERPSFFIYVFRVRAEQGNQDLEDIFYLLEEALRNILSKKSRKESGLNKLVLQVRISWRQLFMIKAYTAYLRQISYAFGIEVIAQVLGRHSGITRMILDLFDARFNPATDRGKEKKALETVLGAIVPVEDALDDRVLRAFVSLVTGTIRTNFYCNNSQCIILKFLSKEIPFCPRPAPYIEAFVFGENVEGCHLRNSIISRGGIRWSDRKQDYRQEALELQQTQTVKNSLIIPSGAKGAFYTEGISGVSTSETGQEAYRIFISSLLEITDNLDKQKKVVHPKNVVVHDRDDFYLAVAADKGTSTFSDLANAIAKERGFWMGDAFASGGCHGYDHKAMGITARGVWVSVMHHLYKKDLLEEDNFTVVGCGDMSGDVFGNGMLLDKSIKLVAAFDYRDIFLDPNPDPEVSWQERKRLFDLPSSSWQDYNKSLVSKGGGIFPRKVKSIPISPEVRRALSISDEIEKCSPQEIVKFILKAKVTLLWFGGIGTYVKSSNETHEEVKDNANVSMRVDGKDLRCTIIGEGANLALTQEGRTEASMSKVVLNTDFIDNAAGVGCSDQEVNLKLLLNMEINKQITLDERNGILNQVQEDVAEKVLLSNARQHFTISLDKKLYKQDISFVLNFLLSQGLNLKKSGMPSARELQFRSITRPEICSMLSHAKNIFKKALYVANVIEDLPKGFLNDYALSYFPSLIAKKYESDILIHPVYDRICITSLVNRMIDTGGVSFLSYLDQEQDKSRIVKAFIITDRLFGIESLWSNVEKKEGLKWKSCEEMFLKIRKLLCMSMNYFLYCAEDLDQALGHLEIYQKNLNLLLKHHEEIFSRRNNKGVEKVHLDVITSLRDYLHVIEIAQPDNLLPFAKAYSIIFNQSHMKWFMRYIYNVNGADYWEVMFIEGLKGKLSVALREFAICMLKYDKDYTGFFSAWSHTSPAKIFSKNMDLLRGAKAINLEQAGVIVLNFEQLAFSIKKELEA